MRSTMCHEDNAAVVFGFDEIECSSGPNHAEKEGQVDDASHAAVSRKILWQLEVSWVYAAYTH